MTVNLVVDSPIISYLFEGGLSRPLVRRSHLNNPITLKYTKNRDFSSCSSPTFTFSFTPKVGLVHLYLSTEERVCFATMGYYGLTDDIDSFKDCWITESYLLSNPSCRELEFKEFL